MTLDRSGRHKGNRKGAPKTSQWDLRVSQMRLWKSAGVTQKEIAQRLQLPEKRVGELLKRFPRPEGIDALMEHADTREAKALTANLHILACRVQGLPFPKKLRIWENVVLTGMAARQMVLNELRKTRAKSFKSTDYHVVQLLAPGLMHPVNHRGVRRPPGE